MARLRMSLVVAGIFFLGAVSGAFATKSVLRAWPHGHRDTGRMERAVAERVSRRLGLDSAQQQVLEEVTRRTRGQFKQLRSEILPRMEILLDQAYQDLPPRLRPDQQKELEKIRGEARERLRRGPYP